MSVARLYTDEHSLARVVWELRHLGHGVKTVQDTSGLLPFSFGFDRRHGTVQIALMNFSFNIRKATEVATQFLQRGGGTINTMKLVKLIYLLDRLSLDRRGIPVVGGDYLSMRNGPVVSEVLAAILIMAFLLVIPPVFTHQHDRKPAEIRQAVVRNIQNSWMPEVLAPYC
ncbi:MAG: DUF4065 domain-containing protein, partial [Pedosphaera sp.]|nr:DUF4065 domain-containing protein [Pedosphaera sp.]